MARLAWNIIVVLTVPAAFATECLDCGNQAASYSPGEIIEASHIQLLQTAITRSASNKSSVSAEKPGLKEQIASAVLSGLPWWNIVPSHPANYSFDFGGHIINLFPGGSAPGDGVDRIQNTEFFGYQDMDPVRDICCPGAPGPVLANVAIPELVAFMVDKSDAKRTDVGVLVLPGGGGNIVVWNYEGIEIAKWLNTIGINAFVLKYRVPAEGQYRELPLIDVQRALSLVRHNATALGLNASRIGALGLSFGGGTIVDLSGSDARAYSAIDDADSVEFRPDFQLLIYPATPINGSEGLHRLQPPTFIATARDDLCAKDKDVEAMAAAMSRTGQDVVDLHIYSRGQHGFGNCKYTASGHFELVCNWLEEAAMFIRRYVLEEVW